MAAADHRHAYWRGGVASESGSAHTLGHGAHRHTKPWGPSLDSEQSRAQHVPSPGAGGLCIGLRPGREVAHLLGRGGACRLTYELWETCQKGYTESWETRIHRAAGDPQEGGDRSHGKPAPSGLQETRRKGDTESWETHTHGTTGDTYPWETHRAAAGTRTYGCFPTCDPTGTAGPSPYLTGSQ